MSDFTDYTETEIVEWLVGGTDMPTAHADVYVGLHTSDPGESPDGSTEVDAGTTSYSRVQTTAGTDWNLNADSFDNAVEIEFPEANGSWGNVSHFSLWDDTEGNSGNALAKSALDTSRDITDGDAPVFRVGSLTGQVD
jgi:hypothetical protein